MISEMLLRRLNSFLKVQQYKILNFDKQYCYINIRPKTLNQKYFHVSSVTSDKLYTNRENDFAHEVLKNTEEYNLFELPTISDVPQCDNINNVLKSCTEKSVNEIFEDYTILARYCKDNNICISNDQFDEFVDVFTTKCHDFSDHQLITSLKYLSFFPETPNIYYKNYVELWSALDEAACSKISNWKTDQVLYVCECWHSISLAKKSNFVWQGLRKIGRKTKKLNKTEMVHSLFFCNLVRNPPLDIFDFEVAFKNNLNQMNIEEIGVVSMGFFKTQTPIRNPELIVNIYERLLNKLDNVKEITLVNILKILRYSSKIPQADIMYELMDKICPYVNKVNLLTCLHIALLGCNMQHCHDKLIELIMIRFYKEIDEARLKDLERISHAMSLYNVPNYNGIKDDLCKKIINEIPKRIDEIVFHPKCFATSLHYMALCGYYNEELINAVLDKKFISFTYGGNLLHGREIFCLDSFTRINLRETYSGNQLGEKYRSSMGKCLTNYIPERNQKYPINGTDRILLEIKESCQKIFKICSIKHVLPHFQRPDIVLCYDKEEKKPINLGPYCANDYGGLILTKDVMFDENIKIENIETVVIVVQGWNNFLRNQQRLTGIAEMKLKQLEILNHKHITVPWYEWRELENENDKQNYLKRKLSSLLKF